MCYVYLFVMYYLDVTKPYIFYIISARRICTISNHLTDRDKILLDMEDLMHRNYPKSMTMTGINKVTSLSSK